MKKLLAVVAVTVSLLGWLAGPASAYNVNRYVATRNVYSGGVLRVYDLAPQTILRQPAYGWYPATCLFASGYWEGYYNQQNGQIQGAWYAAARIVVDDGACGGPTFQEPIHFEVYPEFRNYYGQGSTQLYIGFGCRRIGEQANGVINMAMWQDPRCQPPSYYGVYGDWQRGFYSLNLYVYTGHFAWGPGTVNWTSVY